VKVAACVLSWNPTETGRVDLLAETVVSLREADWLCTIDNGSTDGTEFPGRVWRNDTPNTTSGMGTHSALRVLAGTDADICVCSDDDMVWRPGWRDELERLWSAMPVDVLILGGHLEPEFPWNATGAVYDGWIERGSTGAASWTTTRPLELVRFGARIPMSIQGVWDVPVCRLVTHHDWRIGQADLADHVGDRSTWGNGTVGQYGWDVEPVRERLR
jgi:hypothetical protein